MTTRPLSEAWWDLCHDFLLKLSPEGQILAINGRWQEATAWTSQNLLQTSFTDLLPAEDQGPLTEAWYQMAQSPGSISNITTQILSHDGSVLLVHWRLQLLEQENLVIACGQDLTQLKMSESRAQLLSHLVESSNDMQSVHDKSNRIVYASPGFERVTGYPPSTLVGIRLGQLVHPEDLPSIEAAHDDLLRNPNSSRISYRMIHKDGYSLWVESLCQPLIDENGRLQKVTFSTRDISERRSEENKRAWSKGKMIHASRMKTLGGMAGGVAHEINTPLTSILLSVNTLISQLDNIEAPGQVRTLLEIIESKAAHIEHIVRSLQKFAAGSERRSRPEQLISVADLTGQLVDLCGEQIRAQDIVLEIKHQDPEAQILCHAADLTQALLQLVQNSQEATQDKASKWIKIQSQINKEDILITVTDSGDGIDQEIQSKLINPFFTTKPIGSGTGLGLSIAYGIVRQHRGTLQLDPTSNHTRFLIRLPRVQSHSSAA